MITFAQRQQDAAGLCLVGTAWIGGDKTGAARGTNALDIQSGRLSADRVASGDNASAVGFGNTAGANSSAFGYQNTASDYSSAFGYQNTASGYYASAFGFDNTAVENASAFGFENTASGVRSSAFGFGNLAVNNASAFGYANTASGTNASAFGHRAQTTIDNTFESGVWSNATDRGGAYRTDTTGMSQFTVADAVPTDGGAANGSEPAGTLGRGMYSISRSGLDFILYFNDGGTVRSLNLGTVT